MFRSAALAAALLLVAGCGDGDGDFQGRAQSPAPVDPAIAQALADPIMSDPDLAWQNEGSAALIASGPPSAALPPIDRSEEAIAAARDAAAQLTGGTPAEAPGPSAEDLSPLREAATAARMAAAAGVRPDCAQRLRYTASWAASLPEPLQVYPRGAVEEAAGIDAGGCRLRVVHFKTPVAASEVAAFYDARLRAGGYGVRHGAEGEDRVLRGGKGGADYVIYLRKAKDGLTAADIVVGG